MARVARKRANPGLQDQCRFDEADEAPEWVRLAWRERLQRRAEWTELGKKYERDWRTVKANVTKYSRVVAEAYRTGDVDEFSEYMEGLRDDLLAQLQNADEAQSVVVIGRGEDAYSELVPDYRTRVAARKEVTAIREKIAAARGVTTQRKGVLLGQDPDAEPMVAVGVLSSIFTDPEVADLAAKLERRLAAGEVDTGGIREAAEPGEVATGEAPAPAE